MVSPEDSGAFPKPIAGGARILLVEDNPVNQAVALGMLNLLGCKVVVADHGQAAVERLADEDFDLVLMDCQMPVMDGFEATAEIRRRQGNDARIPIVALTASALDGDRERCLNAGMDDYLSKPFTVESLQSMLKRWLEPGSNQPIPDAPAAPVLDEEVVLDQAALDNIRALETAGNSDMLVRVIELYLANSSELMSAMKQAFAENDSESVRQAAHTLKSSSANLGAMTFSETCRLIEEQSKSPYLHQTERIYHQLARLYPKVVAALQLELQQKSA